MPRGAAANHRGIRCGIDTGGTFTDLVGINEAGEITVGKFPSTPRDPVKAIVGVIRESGVDVSRTSALVLGTTLGLNALLQRKGARVVFITTAGFEDVLFIQRMNRRHHYSFEWVKPEPLAERCDCLGVRERLDARGRVLVPLETGEIDRLAASLDERVRRYSGQNVAVAVCLLFSYLNPEHELHLKACLAPKFPRVPFSYSHEVAPIWREYERASTTVVDAYIKPILGSYVESIRGGLSAIGTHARWTIMKSNGGHATPEMVQQQPVNSVLSGLSGGIIGARYFGQVAQEEDLITLDMGGTSCDVGLIQKGALAHVTNYEAEWGIPISAPFVDVSSIGAGGGSIARVDKGGFLRVGPDSAGAEPGPACYGLGGTEPTVTDANLVLGRLTPDYFLGGRMKLYSGKAEAAVRRLGAQLGLDGEQAAEAILDVADENMANAIRVMSVERGLDPRDFTLVSFGGAGPLHTGGIAAKVGIRRILVPLYPGLCSAFGALIADFQVDKFLSVHLRSTDVGPEQVEKPLQRMAKAAWAELRAEGFRGKPVVTRKMSLRYAGQNYEHDIKLAGGAITRRALAAAFERFHKLHQQVYGYAITREVVEIIRLKLSVLGVVSPPRLKSIARGKLPRPMGQRRVRFNGGYVNCPIYSRGSLPAGATLKGPAILEEEDSTILVHPRNRLTVTSQGVIRITV